MNLYSGPDGCLYIVDMYHGIIQENAYITDYLRGEILKAGYEKNFGRGRIYRVVREGLKPGPSPKLLDATPAELVKHLAHPNGWWRDTAQSLLVTRQVRTVRPALRGMSTKHERVLNAVAAAAPRGRLVDFLATVLAHPLFQQEQLNDEAKAQLNRWQQYCIAGTVAGGSPESFEKLLSIIAKAEARRSRSMLQAISSAISSRKQKPSRAKLIRFSAKPDSLVALEQRPEAEIQEQLKSISFIITWPGLPTYRRDPLRQAPPLNKEERALLEKGRFIYRELCTTCHGPEGRGLKGPEGKSLLAPPLPGSPRLEQNREAAIQVMLHGLIGELDGKMYGGLMAPFGATNDDEWVASVLT